MSDTTGLSDTLIQAQLPALLLQAMREAGVARGQHTRIHVLNLEQVVTEGAVDLTLLLAGLCRDGTLPLEQGVQVVTMLWLYLRRGQQGVRLSEELQVEVSAAAAALPGAEALLGRMAAAAAEALHPPDPVPAPASSPRPMPTAKPARPAAPGKPRRPAPPALGVAAGVLLLALGGYWAHALFFQDRALDPAGLSLVLPVRKAQLHEGHFVIIEMADDRFARMPPEQQRDAAARLLEHLKEPGINAGSIASGDKRYPFFRHGDQVELLPGTPPI